jgi:hypothetical protein
MRLFWNVVSYEFNMSIRRKGLWLAFGLLFAFYSLTSLGNILDRMPENLMTTANMWSLSAQVCIAFNLLMPVVAGISAADRLVRDRLLGVDELLKSTSLKQETFLVAKYLGVLGSLLAPVLGFTLLVGATYMVRGIPPMIFPIFLATFLVMIVPAFALVTAFALGCPTIMPLRVFQVLFTGYWFWGNYLNPAVFPTIAGSLLTANGRIAMEGWFGGFLGIKDLVPSYSSTDVFINLGLLAMLAMAALFTTDRVLTWRARHA